jgi:flagellar hook-length control protein FliK
MKQMITQVTESAGTQAAAPRPVTERNKPEKSFAELLGSRAGKTREPVERLNDRANRADKSEEDGAPADAQSPPAENVQVAAARLTPIIVLPPVSLTVQPELTAAPPAVPAASVADPGVPEAAAAVAPALPEVAAAPAAENTSPPGNTPAEPASVQAALPDAPRAATGPARAEAAEVQPAPPALAARPDAAPEPAAARPTGEPRTETAAVKQAPLPLEQPAPREAPVGHQAGPPAPLPGAETVTVSDPAALIRPRLAQQTAERITVMAEEGIRQFEMTLQPENLGVVTVKLTIEAGRAAVRIETANPLAHQIITSQAAELKEILTQNGLQPEYVHVAYSGGESRQNRDERQPEGKNGLPGSLSAADDEADAEEVLAAGALDYSI